MPRILVTGAAGHLGQRVLHHLLDTLGVKATDVIATTRTADKLADLAARGVEVRTADFEDPSSLDNAFAGAERMLLISTDALDRPGRRLAQHRAAISAAEKAGVKHIVYTSMPDPQNSPLLIAPDHAGTEAALQASSLSGWTVLRNNWYFENIFMTLGQLLGSGKWYSAAQDGRIAHIARDDLARAAAVALTDLFSARRTLTLTGAQAYSTTEIARLVGSKAGKAIEVVQVPVVGLIQGMVQAGLPEPMAQVFASFDTNTAAGRVATVTSDYKTLTGLDPLSYEDWLERHREAFQPR